MKSEESILCEYCDCKNIATVYDEEREAWLCEYHADRVEDKTGYCNVSCQLGYGCDGSC